MLASAPPNACQACSSYVQERRFPEVRLENLLRSSEWGEGPSVTPDPPPTRCRSEWLAHEPLAADEAVEPPSGALPDRGDHPGAGPRGRRAARPPPAPTPRPAKRPGRQVEPFSAAAITGPRSTGSAVPPPSEPISSGRPGPARI